MIVPAVGSGDGTAAVGDGARVGTIPGGDVDPGGSAVDRGAMGVASGAGATGVSATGVATGSPERFADGTAVVPLPALAAVLAEGALEPVARAPAIARAARTGVAARIGDAIATHAGLSQERR